MKITKPEIAEIELNSAITAFFREENPIIIHVLISAAHEIIRKLVSTSKISSVIKDSILLNLNESALNSLVPLKLRKSDLQYKWNYIVNKAYNFMKHADKDADEELEFNPNISVLLILDTLDMFFQIKKHHTSYTFAMYIWTVVNMPELINEASITSNRIAKEAMPTISTPKSEYLELIENLKKTLDWK